MFWQKIRSGVMFVLSAITCPCHLPITLPLFISLTAGTTFSAWLAAPRNLLLVGAISTIVFIGGLALAYRWVSQPDCPPARTPAAKVPHASSQD